jgi:uncharacterized paraquat-inducible protein A
MPTFSCPHCNNTVNTPDTEAGNLIACPNCKQELRVPRSSGSNVLVILLSVGGAVLLMGCLVIVICLAAISVLGQKASATFQSVGQSIGAPPYKAPPPR